MKKILTLILGLSIGSSFFAQNGDGNLHVFNDNTFHQMDLYYTVFTIIPTTCSGGLQSAGPSVLLPTGTLASYATFKESTSNPPAPYTPHPYPLDNWSGAGALLNGNTISTIMATAQKWSYIKFQLRDPNNPGNIPLMSGSVGFYQNCTGTPSNMSDSGTLNGINYSFTAEAFMLAGDKWINIY